MIGRDSRYCTEPNSQNFAVTIEQFLSNILSTERNDWKSNIFNHILFCGKIRRAIEIRMLSVRRWMN